MVTDEFYPLTTVWMNQIQNLKKNQHIDFSAQTLSGRVMCIIAESKDCTIIIIIIVTMLTLHSKLQVDRLCIYILFICKHVYTYIAYTFSHI